MASLSCHYVSTGCKEGRSEARGAIDQSANRSTPPPRRERGEGAASACPSRRSERRDRERQAIRHGCRCGPKQQQQQVARPSVFRVAPRSSSPSPVSAGLVSRSGTVRDRRPPANPVPSQCAARRPGTEPLHLAALTLGDSTPQRFPIFGPVTREHLPRTELR